MGGTKPLYCEILPKLPGTQGLFFDWGSKSRGPHFEEVSLNPATGSEEQCKLPQQGLGRRLSRDRFAAFYLSNLSPGGNNFNDFPKTWGQNTT